MALNKGDLNVDIGARLTKFEKSLSQMQADFKKASANLESTSRKSSATMQNSLGGTLTKIGGIAAAAFATDKILRFAAEAVQLAGKLEGVERAFNRLNNPQLLTELRTATRGTVSDLELMQAAVRANNFKVPLEKLGTFFKFATQRAAETGESVDYLVNSIVDGIGRKSTLVLDNLGISATELQAEVKKTGDFGEAAGNIIERSMRQGADEALTAAQKTAALTAQMTNLQTEIGQQLIPAFNSLASVGVSALNGISDAVKFLTTGLRKDDFEAIKKDATRSFSEITTQIEGATDKQKAYKEWLDKTKQALANAKTAQLEYSKNLAKTGEGSREVVDILQRKKLTYEQILQSLNNYTAGQKSNTTATDAQTQAFSEQAYELERLRRLNDPFSSINTNGPIRDQGGASPTLDVSGAMGVEVIDKELNAAIASAEAFTEANKGWFNQMKEGTENADVFFGVLLNGFSSMSSGAEDFGIKMGNAIGSIIADITELLVKMLLMRGIMAALGMPIGSIGAIGTIGSLGRGIPALAEGGITTGPTLAMIGDNPSGREAVIPLEKMGQFMGGMGGNNVRVTGNLIGRGEDLIVTIDKTDARRQNFYKG